MRWNRSDRRELLNRAARFYWYHQIELAPGIRTDGDYDMGKVWDDYRFPDVNGLSVLDVGRASGFFAFEFERRGAEVVATDIASVADWDWTAGSDHSREALAAGPEKDPSAAFRFAREVRGSQVRDVTMNVYDLSPESLDDRRFDLVFAGSIASHLRDPIRAFERLRSVTDGVCIVAAPSIERAAVDDLSLMVLVEGDESGRTWWVLNAKGLEGMLRVAGFGDVSVVSGFRLRNRRTGHLVDHLVAHARP